MNNHIAKPLLLAALCCTSITPALAKVTLTESLADSLKCSKSGGETLCNVVTTGKFSVTAKISGDTFVEQGITLDTITEDTPHRHPNRHLLVLQHVNRSRQPHTERE